MVVVPIYPVKDEYGVKYEIHDVATGALLRTLPP